MGLLFVRYGLPGLLIVIGLVCLLVVNDSARLEAWAGFTGAGLSVFLLNFLFRLGVEGDDERAAADEAAREYFDEHGAWPEEDQPKPAGRRWTLPSGAVTAEEEERARTRSERG